MLISSLSLNIITYYNFQGPAGSTGMTGAPGTKGETVRNCRCVAKVVAEDVFVFSVVLGIDLLFRIFRIF